MILKRGEEVQLSLHVGVDHDGGLILDDGSAIVSDIEDGEPMASFPRLQSVDLGRMSPMFDLDVLVGLVDQADVHVPAIGKCQVVAETKLLAHDDEGLLGGSFDVSRWVIKFEVVPVGNGPLPRADFGDSQRFETFGVHSSSCPQDICLIRSESFDGLISNDKVYAPIPGLS